MASEDEKSMQKLVLVLVSIMRGMPIPIDFGVSSNKELNKYPGLKDKLSGAQQVQYKLIAEVNRKGAPETPYTVEKKEVVDPLTGKTEDVWVRHDMTVIEMIGLSDCISDELYEEAMAKLVAGKDDD